MGLSLGTLISELMTAFSNPSPSEGVTQKTTLIWKFLKITVLT